MGYPVVSLFNTHSVLPLQIISKISITSIILADMLEISFYLLTKVKRKYFPIYLKAIIDSNYHSYILLWIQAKVATSKLHTVLF